MHVLRREPGSQPLERPAPVSGSEPVDADRADTGDDYADGREQATTCAEHGEVDRGGWYRTHYRAD
jgi:hypothetical protein